MRTTNSYYNNGTLTPTRDPYHHPRGSAKSAPAFLLQPVHDDTGRPTPEDTADNAAAAAAAPQNNPFVLSMIRSDDHNDMSQRLPFRNHRHKEDTCANADAATAASANGTVNATASAAHWYPRRQQSFFPVFRSSPVMPRYPSRDDDRFYTLQRSPAFDCDDDC
jgi:hypothetical protein